MLFVPPYFLHFVFVRPFPRVHLNGADSAHNMPHHSHSPLGPACNAQSQLHAHIPHTDVISKQKDQENDPRHRLEPNKAPDQGCHSSKLYEPLQNEAHFLEDLIETLGIMGN